MAGIMAGNSGRQRCQMAPGESARITSASWSIWSIQHPIAYCALVAANGQSRGAPRSFSQSPAQICTGETDRRRRCQETELLAAAYTGS
jgi:hypothetical protein